MVDYLDHVSADGDQLLVAARAAGLDAPVPSCPGWVVRDLLGHVWEVHAHKELIVRSRLQEPPGEQREPPADGELFVRYAAGLESLVTTLGAADPAVPVWTWSAPHQNVAFWRRRMAHETLIHRVDAELAAGWRSDVDDALAVDGIDEILVDMIAAAPPWAVVDTGERTVRVSAGDRSWTLQEAVLSGTSPLSGTTYERLPIAALGDGGEISTEVRGGGADLDLWLWGRGPLDAITVEGDPDGAAWLRELAAEDTQ